MKKWICAAGGMLVAAGLLGCAGTGSPSVFRPAGTARDQRAQAQWHDPYPENEPAPTLVGSRPREYEKPFAEPLRAQFERWSHGRQQAGP